MVKQFIVVVFVGVLSLQLCYSEDTFRGPPLVEKKPNLLESYLPAAMQIIAHLTELLKYDLRPQSSRPTTSTTTTQRPTSSHKPAIFAPTTLGSQVYHARDLSYEEYTSRLMTPTSDDYLERYLPSGYSRSLKDDVISSGSFTAEEIDEDTVPRRNTTSYSNVYGNLPADLKSYISRHVVDLLYLVNYIDSDDVFDPKDPDEQVDEFSRQYDDSDFRYILQKEKRVPPTRAYVTLLSLYDLLNKEAKKLGLNKYGGYTQNVLEQLVKTSSGTAAEQLKLVLSKMVERRDTKKPDILKKIQIILKDLDEEKSYINDALKPHIPLQFSL